MKQRLGKLALATLTVLVSLVLVEQALRLVGYEYRPMSVQIGAGNDARSYHTFDDSHFVYDSELIWRPKAGYEFFNSQGFRGPEMGEKDPDVLRIVAIGDSNTLGWAGKNGSNWPAVLGRLLKTEGVEAEVVNGGVWGYSSFQGVRRLRDVLTYEPDVVLVSYGSNDAHLVGRTDEDFAGRPAERPRRKRGWSRHRLIQLLTAVRHRVAGGGDGSELKHRVGIDDYRANLDEMVRLAREAGTRLVFLTRPFVGSINDPHWWKNFAYDYNLATVEVAAEQGVPVIDVFTYFKGRSELFSDESHFTDEGHERAGRLVLQDLRPLLSR